MEHMIQLHIEKLPEGVYLATSDEVQGLVLSFLHAGASAVVASLWAVNDQSTARLMQHLHREVAAGQGVAAALRLAILEVKQDRPHPFYWAPFQVLGSWNRVYSAGDAPTPKGDEV